MADLRNKNDGCPWDLEQNFETIAPYTIEEAYEVADAIGRGDMAALKEELGDLLFQVVYHAQLAAEAGAFTFDDVVAAVTSKMVRRHPHVFGHADVATADAQTDAWENHKERERRAKSAAGNEAHSVLDDVPLALPALTRAEKLQKRMARTGFDWPHTDQILDKIEEELGELRAAVASADKREIAMEFGDVLFALANYARRAGIDPEDALRRVNDKAAKRFRYIERRLSERGIAPKDASLDDMEALWNEAKAND